MLVHASFCTYDPSPPRTTVRHIEFGPRNENRGPFNAQDQFRFHRAGNRFSKKVVYQRHPDERLRTFIPLDQYHQTVFEGKRAEYLRIAANCLAKSIEVKNDESEAESSMHPPELLRRLNFAMVTLSAIWAKGSRKHCPPWWMFSVQPWKVWTPPNSALLTN